MVALVGETEEFYYPVVDGHNSLVGAVTIAGIRKTFATQELTDWLVALDIMEPVVATVTADTPLAEAFEKSRRLDVEYIPVTEPSQGHAYVGLLNCCAVRRCLSAEVLARQQKADTIHSAEHT
jgi:CBS domain-containing protein